MTIRPEKILPHLADVVLLAGAGCVVGGVWWIYPPAGLILLGLGLVAGAILGAKAWAS